MSTVDRPWNIAAIAHDLKVAQDLRMFVAPLTRRYPGIDNAAAYEIAHAIHAARLREGARVLGRKIGFTNRNIWPEYGVYEPIWAHVYDTTVEWLDRARGECSLAPFAEPRIEPEIVLKLKEAPRKEDDPIALLGRIEWIAHGYEIVQSHFRGWKFQAPDTIADSGLHGRLLVGPPHPVAQPDPGLAERLSRFAIRLACNGEGRAEGTGANVLDGPLQALAHLVQVLARDPQASPIAGGEIVTTGTLTAALPIRAGETWSTTLEGIALPGLAVAFR